MAQSKPRQLASQIAAEQRMRAFSDIPGVWQHLVLICLAGGISLALAACGPQVTAPRSSAPTAVPATYVTPRSAPTADHAAHGLDSTASPDHAEHLSPAAPSPAPTPSAAAPRTRVAGSGESNSGAFQLERGLATFHFDHPSSTPFGAFLLNEAGDHLALLANGTVVTGTQVFGVQAPGTHSLHVLATDAWSITIEQPGMIGAAADLPARLGGYGAGVTAPLALPAGQVIVRWSHAGTLPATLTGWSSDGQQRLDIMTNQQSPEASISLTVTAPGDYLFNVLADGTWTLAIEPQ